MITKLLYFQVDLDAHQHKIQGYKQLKTLISDTKQAILQSNTMLVDLLKIVSRCIII